MKVIGYYVSMISLSIIDANNLDQKILVNNIMYLFILSLINFNKPFFNFNIPLIINFNKPLQVITISALPFLGGQSSVPNFEKGGPEKKCLGGLKESLSQTFAQEGGLTMFLVKKDFVKLNMVLRDKFSNVSLGLFQPNNQLMFSFVTT